MRVKFIIMLLLAVSFYSCTKKGITIEEPPAPAPMADFIYTIGNVPKQSTVAFTNKSLNGKTYNWNFGDGKTSSEENPTHFYQNGGTYTVKLTVTNASGASTIEKTVSVAKPYTAVIIEEIGLDDYWPNTIYDWGSDPDIYIVVTNGTNVISSRSTAYQNVPNNTSIYWRFNNKYTVEPLSKTINVTFWDADDPGDPDDRVDDFNFTPADYTTGPDAFPSFVYFGDTYMKIRWE